MQIKTWVILIIVSIGAIETGYSIMAVNQINSQKIQIAMLQGSIKNDNSLIKSFSSWIEDKETPADNPYFIPPKTPTVTSTTQSSDPHAGMKEVKTMNCQPEGSNGATNCTEYNYWYNPNTAPTASNADSIVGGTNPAPTITSNQ